MSEPILMVVDGNALVHRAFHAMPALTSPRGELVNAVFGVAQMLLKALADLRPRYVAAAFDTAAPTFRHESYADYKGTRAPAAEGLYEQFERVYELLEALGIPRFRLDGFEADDLLGALARQANAQGVDVVIVTGDLDALQLVGPHVRVMTSRRGMSDIVMYDEAAVRERFGGLTPAQIVDYKALAGDTSDNIPGVPGIGKKTAERLLLEHGDVATLYAHLDRLSAKQRDQLAPYADQVREARRLAEIVTDLPVQLDLAACVADDYDRGRAVALFHTLGFRSLLDRLPAARSDEPSGAAAPGTAAAAPVEPSGDGQLGLLAGPAAAEVAVAPASSFATGAADGAVGDRAPRAEPSAGGAGVVTTLVTTGEALTALSAALRASQGFAFSVQTTGLDAMRCDLVGLAFATGTEQAWYIPLGHHPTAALLPGLAENGAASEPGAADGLAQLDPAVALAALRPALEDAALPKRAYNAKFAIVVLDRHGVGVRGLSFDGLVAAYLLEGSQRALALRDLAYNKLGVDIPSAKTLLGEGKRARTMAEVPLDEAATYAGTSAALVDRLEPVLLRDLAAAGLAGLYRDLELPLVPVLACMERHGVAIDVPYLHALSRELYDQIQALEAEVYNLAGGAFNINSPPQLSDVLFNRLGLKPPAGKRTKTGHISTNVQVLAELRGAHPAIDQILRVRQLVKLKSTYVDALPLLVHPETGRVHTSFNQALTSTGRISSSDPNLQNIPIRTALGRRVRQAFVAPAGWRLLGADYSQIELRILAHLTGEPALVEAFSQGVDIHAATAARILSVPLAEVTADQRRIAKTVNFGVLYRISDYGLASRLRMPQAEASAFIKEYFERYPTVRGYQEQVLAEGRARGYVTTLLGRRRYLPELTVKHTGVRQAAERMAVNAPIQGTAADIIKQAMIDIQAHLDAHHPRAKMLLQVHDELVFEVPEGEVAALAPAVKRLMEGAFPLTVPVVVDVKTGQHWGEMTPAPESEEPLLDVEE